LQFGEILQGVVAVCGHDGEVRGRWIIATKYLGTCGGGGGGDWNDGGAGVGGGDTQEVYDRKLKWRLGVRLLETTIGMS
jgi:hypothetical protein